MAQAPAAADNYALHKELLCIYALENITPDEGLKQQLQVRVNAILANKPLAALVAEASSLGNRSAVDHTYFRPFMNNDWLFHDQFLKEHLENKAIAECDGEGLARTVGACNEKILNYIRAIKRVIFELMNSIIDNSKNDTFVKIPIKGYVIPHWDWIRLILEKIFASKFINISAVSSHFSYETRIDEWSFSWDKNNPFIEGWSTKGKEIFEKSVFNPISPK